MHTIIIPTIMTVVLTGESGKNRQDTIIPVPAPEKKSTTDFSCLIFPITLSLSIDCTILESSFNKVSRQNIPSSFQQVNSQR